MGLTETIDAGQLSKEFAMDLKTAERKYKNRYITVVGEVSQSYKNKYQESIIILMDKDKKYGVKCILNKNARQINEPLKQGQIMKINGKCSGLDDYVVLNGCLILRN